ncbi:hypothetical protein GOBAR_AA25009 [Gossypium barbadense]|uniref:Uncharacterized protein n=1 Tax=Gossypium barbadense TaxID=3634 RepID=A0A2P5WX55_GOSBA|nr:hypothetical protein GOBAR_AA25009 [Gossypium barbadense]
MQASIQHVIAGSARKTRAQTGRTERAADGARGAGRWGLREDGREARDFPFLTTGAARREGGRVERGRREERGDSGRGGAQGGGP